MLTCAENQNVSCCIESVGSLFLTQGNAEVPHFYAKLSITRTMSEAGKDTGFTYLLNIADGNQEPEQRIRYGDYAMG